MGVLQQFRLLLNKNLLLRKRHPGFLVLEIIWPVLIIAIVALIRTAVPPRERTSCHYQDRAMPSAGLVPFMQTFVCNLDNKCHTEDSRHGVQQTVASVSALVQKVTPFLGDEGTLDMLDKVDSGVTLITSFNNLMKDDNIMKELDNSTNLANYFREPDKIKRVLISNYKFTQDAANALVGSQANISAVLQMAGYPDLKGVACDPTQLSMFLIFPEGANVTEISRTLCDINDSRIPEITRFLQEQLDVAEMIRLLGKFETLKERLNIPYTMAEGLNDIADMLDLLLSNDGLVSAVKELAGIKNLPDIIRNIPNWIEQLMQSESAVKPLKEFVTTLDPIVTNIFPNDTMWMFLKDSISLGAHFTDIVNDKGNTTAANFMQRFSSFVQDIENVFSEMSPDVKQMLDGISALDWPQLWQLAFNTNNQTAMTQWGDILQRAVSATALSEDISGYLHLVSDLVNSINIILRELIEAHENLLELKAARGGELKQMVDNLLEKGPNVTLAVLKAFTHSDTLAMLFSDGAHFSTICMDILKAIGNDTGPTVVQELNTTLCHSDASHAINSILGELGVSNISVAISQTIATLMSSFSGNMTEKPLRFTALWQDVQMMLNSVDIIVNDTYFWTDLFSVTDVFRDFMYAHSKDWEPVLDMLDENYIGSSVLGLIGAAVKRMNDSSSAQWMEANLGPYVHMAAVMIKTFYSEMKDRRDTFSRDSPLGQLVYYSTSYAPEIVSFIMDMGKTENMEMINTVASSSDPLSEFCRGNMMQQLGVPYDVAVTMGDIVCLSNWTKMGTQLMSTTAPFSLTFEKMMETMTEMENNNISYSLENDWNNLTYYTSRTMDMLMSSNQVSTGDENDPLQMMMSFQGAMSDGPWSLAMYANYSQLNIAMEMPMKRLLNMTEDDLNGFINILSMTMENIERSMTSSIPSQSQEVSSLQWRLIKHYFRILDDVNIIVMDMNNQEMTTSIQSMVESYPEEVKHMVNLTADAYPELIDALKYIIFKPDQFIRKMISQGLQAPNCDKITVTDLLTLAPDSSFGLLEKAVCTANWTDIGLKMASTSQSQSSAAIDELTALIYDLDKLQIDPTVNWTEVMHNTVQAVKTMLAQLDTVGQTSSSWDLLPFNMTAIRAKWAQFYEDMNQLGNIDFASLSVAVQDLQLLLMGNLMQEIPGNAELLQMLNANLFLSQHLMEFFNIQLTYLNATSEVNILDMLGSDELRKLAQVLHYSPEINEIGVNTLMRVLSDPTKIIMMDPSVLCTNMTLFRQMVAVDDSVINTALLQNTVCSMNVNTAILVDELRQNWNGFAALMDAFQSLIQLNGILKANTSALAVSQQDFSKLLESVLQHPPTIRLFDNQWMNTSLYEGPWKTFVEEMEKVFEKYQNPDHLMSNLQASVISFLYSIAENPEMQTSLLYMDVIMDQVIAYTSSLSSFPQSFSGYPNLKTLYSLLEQLPELLEMLAYTSLKQPVKLNNWGGAMTSWEAFCSTDPTTLMEAPGEGGLSVREVFGRLCSLNITQLGTEYNAFQGMEQLNKLFAGENVTRPVNVTSLAEKLTTVLADFNINSSEIMDSNIRFLNSSVWTAVFDRLGQNFNQSLTDFMSPDFLRQILGNISHLFPEFGGFQGTVEQVLAITDIVLDQMLKSLQGGSLQEIFSQYPTVKTAVTLMEKLPEIYETLAYTGLYTPQKLMENFQDMMSFEMFCSTDINLILTPPPVSGYNLSMWQHMMCSINVTTMLEELAEYQGTMTAFNFFMPNNTFSVNLTSLSEKVDRVSREFGRLLSGNSTSLDINTYIDVTAWGGVMQHLQTWMQDASQLWSSPSFYKNLVSASVLSSFQAAIPGINIPLQYTSAILDLFEQSLESSTTPLSKVFANYPNMNTMHSLLQDVPDIFEIIAYTTLQHQEQIQMWATAMASWETFCSYDPNSLLTAPPGGRVTVINVLQRLCSVNVTELLVEFNHFQAVGQLQEVLSGNIAEEVNVTAIAEQLSNVIDGLKKLYTLPMEAVYDLRLFNQTVWEQVFERLGNDFDRTQERFMSPDMLTDFFKQLFSDFSALNDIDGMLNKTLAMTDIVLSQMLRSLQGGSLEEMFQQYPTFRSAVGLLDSLPEIYETVMYTALFAPDKVLARMDAFSSLQAFCTTDLKTIYMVPEAVDFNITAWQEQFCSLNLTVLMIELAEYQGSQDIANLFAPNSTVMVNITSVLQKMESVLDKLSHMNNTNAAMMNLDARFLNATLWEKALNNLEKWVSNPNAIFWMDSGEVMQLYDNLMTQFPDMMQGLEFVQPVYSVMSLITERLIRYENKTSFTLEELFVGAPEMQKLVQLLQQPGIISVLFESLNTKKFEPLLTASSVTTAFVMLCAPSATLDQYLTVPNGVFIDLSALKTRFCDINLTLLPRELMEFLGVDNFMAAVNGSLHVDYTELNQQVNQMSAMITRWTQMPPIFSLPKAWQNDSFWFGMLERYSMSRQDPEAILQEVETFIDSLGPIVAEEPMRQIALVAETVMHLLNKNLQTLKSQNLTLENVIHHVPILQEVFSALGVQGDILDTMLKAPVQSGQMIVEALLSSGTAAQESVCNITRLQEMLKLPVPFNTTALYQVVCLQNSTEAVNNLIKNLNLQDLINDLESTSRIANWSEVFQQSQELQEIFQDLITHPPTFNVTTLMDVLDRSFNTSDLWQMMTMLNYDQLFGMIDAFPVLKPLEGILKSSNVIAEFLNNLVSRLVMDGTTIDLASLFSSSPSFVKLIDAALHARPDPVSAVSFIQVNPSKVNEFMTLDTTKLQSIMCTPSEFQQYFILPDGANVTEVLGVLCSMNFTLFVEELEDTFMVDTLTEKFAMAMNGSGQFNIQEYMSSYVKLIEHITTLTGAKNITFDGNDIGHAFDINITKFLQTLESVSTQLQAEYPSLMTFTLNNALADLASTSEGQTLIYSLKVIQLYLHSFIKELEDISSGPISLAAIVNNTEVGNIIMPFLQNPYSLQDLLDLELLPQKLNTLLTSDSVMDALCGPELFTAFAAPGNDSAILQQLQTSACSTNTTVMMWQAVMGQASGYQLYKQMQALQREVAAGKVTTNFTAINSDVEHLITMITHIVQEYQTETRSSEDILDWHSFENIFNQFSASLAERLANMSQQWSMTMSGTLLSAFPNDYTSTNARIINTFNIFMKIINDRLDDTIKNGVSLYTLLNHSSTLVHLMEAYLDVTQLSPQAWLNNQFNISKMIEVAFNESRLTHLCTTQTLDSYLADGHNVSTVTSAMQTVLCSIVTELPDAFRDFVDYATIQQQLTDIWNISKTVQPDYQQYVDNTDMFSKLITKLATTPPNVDPQLSSMFSFTNILETMENIVTKPEMIFQLLKAFGIVLDGSLKTNDLENTIYGLNAYVAQPLLDLVENMDHAGVSFSTIQQDPSKMLQVLPVLLNFDLHFDVITSSYLQPTINKFWNNEDFRNNHLCNGNLSEEVFTSVNLQPSVVRTLCTVPTTQWVQTLKALNATEAQILSWVRKVDDAYWTIPNCYYVQDATTGALIHVCNSYNADMFDNKGMYWIRLMSTLESVASRFVPDSNEETAVNVGQSLNRMVDILRDAFLNKTLNSAMKYMEAVDLMGVRSEEWILFKQIMRFLASAGNLLNSGLQNSTDPTGTLHLQKLLPDPQKLSDLLHDILGPASASEILTASVNPQMFYMLAYPGKLQDVSCDSNQFSSMFNFPVGTNITAIQVALCDALNSHSGSVQQLVDLFQAGDVLVQLDKLLHGNYSSAASDTDLWQAVYDTVSGMLTNLEQLQNGNFNMTMTISWLNPILQQLAELNQVSDNTLKGLCDNFVTLFGGTAVYQAEQKEIATVARIINVATKVMPFITRMDDLICTTVTENGLDLPAALDYLQQHGLHELLLAVSDMMRSGTNEQLQCRLLVDTSNQFSSWIMNITRTPIDIDHLAQCMEQGSPMFADVLQGFTQIYSVMANISSLLSNEDISALFQNSGELGNILNFVLKILLNEKSVALQFADLFINSTDVESYLQGVARLTPEAVRSLLASTVNLNASSFLNNSVVEIANILCQPTLLQDVVTLPDFSTIGISEISKMLCSNDVNFTAALLRDAGQSLDFITALTERMMPDSSGLFVRNVTTSLTSLITDLQSISVLMDMMGNGFDKKFLMENADSIDEILTGGGTIQKIVNSLSSLVGSLKYLVPPENHSIITDIQSFISGLIGLDLIQSRLLSAIHVADLQKDIPGMNLYLTDDLGFDPQAATALLSSTYSIRVFLNASGLLVSEEPCDTRLKQYILLNTTQELEQEITSKFCNLNTTEITVFMEFMVPELDIGSLIQRYITYSGKGFLNSVNMTQSEVETVFKSLSDGGQALEQAAVILKNDNSTLTPLLSSFDPSTEGEFDALVSLQPALCGDSGSLSDQFNLGSKVQGAQSQVDVAEETQLNGEFCKNLYRNVKGTSMGSVIWAFIKPIMSGMVLYTPDTPLTREIVAEANWVFDTLSEVKRVSKLWSEKAPSLMALTDSASEMSSLQDTLDNGFIQGIMRSSLGVDPASVSSGLDSLKSNNMNNSDISSLQKLAEMVYNYTSCLNLNRFEGVSSEAELEQKAFELYKTNNFLGGIVFLNMEENTGNRRKRQANNSSRLPQHIQYKLRMDIDSVPTTNRIKDRLWMPYARDNFASHMRYMRGFVQLQDMVDNAILRLQTGGSYNTTGVSMQQMPFPCHKEDDYIHYLGSYLLPILMTFAWLAAIGIATHNLVYDRQSGQEESLHIMGMISGLNVLAWLLMTMLIMAVVTAIITIVFKYAGVFHNSNWLLLFLFFLDFCFSTTMMCYFISSFFSRVTLAMLSVLIIYFISFLPYVILVSAEVQMTMWQKSLASLSSTTAFSFGAIFITRFEEETTGLQWDNVNDKIGDSVDFAWMCYMMLIDSAIYLVLGWYIRNVKPGKYGVSQPWYFPVLPSYWCSCLSQSPQVLPPPDHNTNQGLHEPPPENLDIGISVRKLRKVFKGKEEVVHGLDFDIFHDQITTLLGHNGAAKTTTLNMMVGVLDPTGGVVLVEGKKTQQRTGLIGICPQHNTLFEYMTVMEHMEFYGGVKGRLSKLERMRESRKLLHDVDLWHMKDVPAKDLSGGMQRRLCVALAFAGGSKTIILDEPTSGVDPHARKNIWNLVLKNRPGRTILLSTHHLDEADMLSDRILIMHSGRLMSAGSPAFMKDQLGAGYKLTLNTNPTMGVQDEMLPVLESADVSSEQMSSQHAKVMAFIKSKIPSAQFLESVGTDLTVSLPNQEDNTAMLSQFFGQLDAQKSELDLLSYGISSTTLEEVFLKLTSEADRQMSNNRHGRSNASFTDSESVSTDSGSTILKSSGDRPKRTIKGVSLKFQQMGALLLKRFHHYRRNWRMGISTLFLPLLAFLCAMGFSTLRPTGDNMQSLLMSPALYAQAKTSSYAFIKDNQGSGAYQHFKGTLMANSPGIGTTCMEGFNPGKDFKCVTPGMMEESEKLEQVCHCSDYAYQCKDGSQKEGIMQKMTRPNIMLQDLGMKDVNKYLLETYMNYIDQRFGGWSLEPSTVSGNTSTSAMKVWFNNKGYHALPSFFNALSNNLLRTAVHPTEAANYGITLYNHPLMLSEDQLSQESIESSATDVGIAMVILLALSFIPSAFMVYLTNEKQSQEKHLQSINGVGTGLYWMTSYLWDMVIYTCALAVMVAIVAIFQSEGLYDRENLAAFTLLVFLFGLAVIPLMYCTLRLFTSGSSAYLTLFCGNMIIGLITTITVFVLGLLSSDEEIESAAKILKYVFLVFPQFCLGIGLVDLVSNQFQYKLLKRFGDDTYVSPFDLEMLGWKFVALAIEAVVFLLLTFIIHSRKERALSMSNRMHYNASKEDEDVFLEQERVRSSGNRDALTVKELCKVYNRGLKKFCAVNHLSFGVERGQCFGLLGVNGAGKTTTFKMLTGATTPSEGKVVINQQRVSSLGAHLGDEIGYCTQEDALDMYLSGRETLMFHARLQGFGSEAVDAVVSEQLKQLQLENLADKPVHTYSGGNKRKLALAVAMLGEPSVLLLDEPTTGMDAYTRRLAWKCIVTATQRGQSVVLTSHSMDECDALCSRLAIMVNGQLKCIGSPQHLKNKFGEGYTVILHLHGLSNTRYNVADSFLSQFPGSVIKVSLKMKDQHHSVIEVCIPRGAGSVSDILAAVHHAKEQNNILYYSVSQTTLDTVFVNFAREQTDDDDHDSDIESSSGSSSGKSGTITDPSFHKSFGGGTYAYMNPEYSVDSMDSFGASESHPSFNDKGLAFNNSVYDNDLFVTRM